MVYMVDEHRIKKVGTSQWLLIPWRLIKTFNLDKYIYHLEVSKDGKKIIFLRMREDETKVEENE